MAGNGCSKSRLCSATELVEHAKVTLLQREQKARDSQRDFESKKEQIKSMLLKSMRRAEEQKIPESVAELEYAVRSAQEAGVLPGLRVQARKLLCKFAQADKCVSSAEELLQRITKQLDAVHAAGHLKDNQDTGIRNPAAQHLREDHLIRQLNQAVAAAAGLGVAAEVTERAKAVVRKVEKDRRAENLVAKRLQGLLLVDDAEALGDRLKVARRQGDLFGEGARHVVSKIQHRVEKMATQEQHQEWLNAELSVAAHSSDPSRLKQLFDQAKALNLTVPPPWVALLHDLEVAQSGQRSGVHHAKGLDVSARLQSCTARQCAAVEAALAKAADFPAMEELDAARRAVVNAEQARLPSNAVLTWQRQLASIEQQHRQRLQVEADLERLLRVLECRQHADDVLHDGHQVDRLRSTLEEAELCEADPCLVADGIELLERSTASLGMRRHAEDRLRHSLARPLRSEANLELLQEAIKEGKQSGIATLHAEKELARAREEQVYREAAEAELQEAAKGLSLQGRARLEAAVHSAKRVGVSVEKLRAANVRLTELREHEEQCAVAAGNLRRAFPLLEAEPWRFQQVMETVQVLKPWTAELEKLIRDGEQHLEKALTAQSRQKEAAQELRLVLQHVQEGWPDSNPRSDHVAELSKCLAQARAAKVGEELLREVEKQLRSLQREGCQLAVAEHRLRLALSARSPTELERSLQQVRAAGQAGQHESATLQGAAARAEAVEAPRSARLLEAALSR